jgi:hypothetical protein
VYDESNTIDWKWQVMDGAIIKALLGGKNTGANLKQK